MNYLCLDWFLTILTFHFLILIPFSMFPSKMPFSFPLGGIDSNIFGDNPDFCVYVFVLSKFFYSLGHGPWYYFVVRFWCSAHGLFLICPLSGIIIFGGLKCTSQPAVRDTFEWWCSHWSIEFQLNIFSFDQYIYIADVEVKPIWIFFLWKRMGDIPKALIIRYLDQLQMVVEPKGVLFNKWG